MADVSRISEYAEHQRSPKHSLQVIPSEITDIQRDIQDHVAHHLDKKSEDTEERIHAYARGNKALTHIIHKLREANLQGVEVTHWNSTTFHQFITEVTKGIYSTHTVTIGNEVHTIRISPALRSACMFAAERNLTKEVQIMFQAEQLKNAAHFFDRFLEETGHTVSELFEDSDTLEQCIWDLSDHFRAHQTGTPWNFIHHGVRIPATMGQQAEIILEDQELMPFLLSLYSIEQQTPSYPVTARSQEYLKRTDNIVDIERTLQKQTLGKMAEYVYVTLAKDFLSDMQAIHALEQRVYGHNGYHDPDLPRFSTAHKAASFHDHIQRTDVIMHLTHIGETEISLPLAVDILFADHPQMIANKEEKLRRRDTYTYRVLGKFLKHHTASWGTYHHESNTYRSRIDGHVRILHAADPIDGKDLPAIGVLVELSPDIWKPVLGVLPSVIIHEGASSLTGAMIQMAFHRIYGEEQGDLLLIAELHKMQTSLVAQVDNRQILRGYRTLVEDERWRG